MPNVLQSREATISKMLTQSGVSWPNPWWPNGRSSYDDCAAAVSWALFGLNDGQPFQTYVSGVIERAGLTKYNGSYGLQRGDVVGFLWGGDNNYDHTELALSEADSRGNFQTIGTNAAPSDAMAIRARNTRYVVAYARPAYLASTAGDGGDVLIQPTGAPMFNLIAVPDAGLIYIQGIDGRREGIQSTAHLDALIRLRNGMLTPGAPMTMYFGDLNGQRGNCDWYLKRVNGQEPAKPAAAEPFKFSDDDLAKLGAVVRIDVDELVSKIGALDDADHAALLAAINKPRTVS